MQNEHKYDLDSAQKVVLYLTSCNQSKSVFVYFDAE